MTKPQAAEIAGKCPGQRCLSPLGWRDASGGDSGLWDGGEVITAGEEADNQLTSCGVFTIPAP
jgi:hypothetical protein